MSKNFVAFSLLAACCLCWLAVECKKLSELGLDPKHQLSEDEDVDPDDENDEQWTKYKAKYGKEYKDNEEELKKKAIFRQNLKLVAEHNMKYLNHEISFKTKIDKFSTWSPDEVNKNLLSGVKVPDESQIKREPSAGRDPKQKFHPDGLGERPKRAEAMPPPAALDYRKLGFVTPVKQQDPSAALEGVYFGRFGVLTNISEQNLVDCSKNGNEGCNGGWPIYAFDWVAKNGGIMESSTYPFTGLDGPCKYNASLKTPKLKVIGGKNLPKDDEEALKVAVWEIGPIAVAINGNSSGFRHYSGQDVYIDPHCSKEPNHAVVIVGYDRDEKGQDYWIVKNSWGARWGDNGYIKMARNKGNQCGIASFGQYPVLG